MLVKLLPDQVSKNWDTIGFAIGQSLPPIVGESDDNMNSILMAILEGTMECWVSYKVEDEVANINAVVSTRILEDDITGVKDLLLYSIFAFNWLGEDGWAEGFNYLSKYAKGKGCSRIIGYTAFDSMIERAREMGAEAKYMFVSWDL